MVTLSLAKARRTTADLHLIDEMENAFIFAVTGVISLVGASLPVSGIPFPEHILQSAQAILSVYLPETQYFRAIWNGIAPSGCISVIHTPTNLVWNAPVLIRPASGKIQVSGAATARVKRHVFLFPAAMFTGYSSDGASISIPIASLPGMTAQAADAATGDWRSIFQSALMQLHVFLERIPATYAVNTVKVFALEDWSRNNAKFGRHMKRLFLVEFTVENSPTNVFNSGE